MNVTTARQGTWGLEVLQSLRIRLLTLLLPAGKNDLEWLGQDGESRAVVQAWRMVFVLVGG